MSLSKVSTFTKDVRTWRAYPRVHYFYRRYNDLLPRFHRIIGSFPKSFQDKGKLSEITEIADNFNQSLKINVTGWESLDIAHIVVSTKALGPEQLPELSETAKVGLNVCYVKLNKLDIKGQERLKEVIAYFDTNVPQMNQEFYSSLFIVVDIDTQPFEEDVKQFRKSVIEIVEKFLGDKWEHPDRIIFDSHGCILSSKISEMFESRLVNGFHNVLGYLESFGRKTKQYNADIKEIIHCELVVKSIQALLRDDIGLADMRIIAETEKSEETEGMSSDDKFLHQFLKKLARLVKCGVVEPLSFKYNVPPWICNQLLGELNFETKIMEAVSRNTKHHLRKLNDFSKDFDEIVKTHKRKANMGKKDGASKHEYFIRFVSYKFDFIVYPLQNDMSKVINDAEKTMASAGHIIVIMGKMIFEIEGYLEQTITETYIPTTQTPVMPKGLRSAILELEDVHAVGTIYDVVEVHVLKETDDLKNDVSHLMQKHEFRLPYKVKTVQQQAKVMMADIQHENGKLIKSPFPDNRTKYRNGTLGAFVQADDHTLYGLTCAHVVSYPDKEEHDVYIQERGLRLRKFGKSQRKLTINTGTGTPPLIDIAAVRVNVDFVGNCIRRMKDDSGINKPAAVAEETVSQLLKRFAYKHGAMSGLTRGIICSTDFSVSDAEEDSYLIMIESAAGDENSCFAKGGDSGAVICTSAVDTDSIKVVGMLSAGDYTLTGGDKQEKCLCFLLKTGLEKLRDRSNISLNVA